MPTYEYLCDEGHTFDVVQRMSDDALVSCEVCEAPVRRVLHAPAVHFKGKGFYNTDYGTKNRQREKEASDASSSKSSSDGGTGGGDSKPAEAKPEKKPEKKETAAASGS